MGGRHMRLYSFTNYYLSSLQNGLQTAHVVSDLFALHPENRGLQVWAAVHKTIIILTGGNSTDLDTIGDQLDTLGGRLGLATATFHEDGPSLNHATTACGIIVPANVYEYAAIRVFDETNAYMLDTVNDDERELANLIKSYPLAR
jgi:hypothetical protein